MNIRALVNLDALEANFYAVKSLLKSGVNLGCVVKADAYGHGAVSVARLYEKLGASYLFVARVSEGVELRRAGIKLPILLLSPADDDIEKAIKFELELTVFSLNLAIKINDLATKLDTKAKIHIAIDSGMGRIGYLSENSSIVEILRISKLSNLELKGIFTHFSNADEQDDEFSQIQLRIFNKTVDDLANLGVKFPLIHASNSAAIHRYKDANFTMVRAGISLYGYHPFSSLKDIKLTPAMSLEAKVISVKTLPKGSPIGYGMTYYVKDECEKIATIAIGYADGFCRSQVSPEVVIKGVKCPVVGRICMDLSMVKVPLDMSLEVGEWACVFDENLITAKTLATKNSTISYEVLCSVRRRTPRVYIRDGKVVSVVDYLEI